MTGTLNSGESKVLNVGEFPVDVMKVSDISLMSNWQMNGNRLGSVVPSLQNAFFIDPQQQGDTWAKRADMPTARSHTSSSVVNGKIYVIGGYSDKDFLPTVEEYDPAKDK